MSRFIANVRCAALAFAIAPVATLPLSAETLVGSNVDSRLILAFAANHDAVQALMPEGWNGIALPGGAMAGANLILVLIDRHLGRGPDGAPLDPPQTRSSAIAALGTHPDHEGARLFVLRQYEIGVEGGPYQTTVPTAVSRTASLDGPADGVRIHREDWVFEPKAGGSLTVSLSYAPGTPSWGAGEGFPYSPIDTDFQRIYRFNQLVDVAMSAELGRELAGEVTYTTDIAELAPIFDGSEELRAVLSIPIYVREVLVP